MCSARVTPQAEHPARRSTKMGNNPQSGFVQSFLQWRTARAVATLSREARLFC